MPQSIQHGVSPLPSMSRKRVNDMYPQGEALNMNTLSRLEPGVES